MIEIPKRRNMNISDSDFLLLGEIGKDRGKNNASKGVRILLREHRKIDYPKGRKKKNNV